MGASPTVRPPSRVRFRRATRASGNSSRGRELCGARSCFAAHMRRNVGAEIASGYAATFVVSKQRRHWTTVSATPDCSLRGSDRRARARGARCPFAPEVVAETEPAGSGRSSSSTGRSRSSAPDKARSRSAVAIRERIFTMRQSQARARAVGRHQEYTFAWRGKGQFYAPLGVDAARRVVLSSGMPFAFTGCTFARRSRRRPPQPAIRRRRCGGLLERFQQDDELHAVRRPGPVGPSGGAMHLDIDGRTNCVTVLKLHRQLPVSSVQPP